MKYRNWWLSISIAAMFSTLVFTTEASLADNISSLKDGNALEATCPDKDAEKRLGCYLKTLLVPETSAIVRIPTYKGLENLQGNLNQVKNFLRERAEAFNQTQTTLKFRFFEWYSEISALVIWLSLGEWLQKNRADYPY